MAESPVAGRSDMEWGKGYADSTLIRGWRAEQPLLCRRSAVPFASTVLLAVCCCQIVSDLPARLDGLGTAGLLSASAPTRLFLAAEPAYRII